jgi:hypothetical protein
MFDFDTSAALMSMSKDQFSFKSPKLFYYARFNWICKELIELSGRFPIVFIKYGNLHVRESDFSLMPSKKLFPLYHGKNKLLIVLKRDDDDDIRFIHFFLFYFKNLYPQKRHSIQFLHLIF